MSGHTMGFFILLRVCIVWFFSFSANGAPSQEEEYEPFGVIRANKLIGLFPFDRHYDNIAPLFADSR